MQGGKRFCIARPQSLTCQERRRSAAAAHAKGPARPVMKLALRAQGLWRKDPQIFKFLAYIATFFQNPCCAARGHALAVWLRLATLVGQTRSALRNNKFIIWY